MSVFFLGSWGMNRSTEQTNRPRTASQLQIEQVEGDRQTCAKQYAPPS